MSTQIFLPSEKLCADSAREQAWLIDEVIRPQLPNIKENLASCMAKISENNGDEFKFPLSSHNSETLKGVISRSNFRVTGLSVSIRSKSIGRALHLRLKDNSTLILRQLLDCHDLIYNAINTISKIQTLQETQPAVLLKILSTLYGQIQLAKKSLLFPTEAYMFPRYRLPYQLFEPELPENVALDLVISNSDLSIDLKVVKPITHRPWDLIIDVPNRVSFADHTEKRRREWWVFEIGLRGQRRAVVLHGVENVQQIPRGKYHVCGQQQQSGRRDDPGDLRRGDERPDAPLDHHQTGQSGEKRGQAAGEPQADLDASLSFLARRQFRRAMSSREPDTFWTFMAAPCCDLTRSSFFSSGAICLWSRSCLRAKSAMISCRSSWSLFRRGSTNAETALVRFWTVDSGTTSNTAFVRRTVLNRSTSSVTWRSGAIAQLRKLMEFCSDVMDDCKLSATDMKSNAGIYLLFFFVRSSGQEKNLGFTDATVDAHVSLMGSFPTWLNYKAAQRPCCFTYNAMQRRAYPCAGFGLNKFLFNPGFCGTRARHSRASLGQAAVEARD
ncbi:hypothetical protein KL933_001169 [Ogataea haglerorum]|uniref:Uncharacterized protein n=1 Tax=Ogataea haglerorum TaxID=1937702 RepID=A0AAN6D8K5_9ASCO|nr:uncharacterized protein KL911_001825 [Ogataea haglerorum]KAG7699484.1 hypothetical protein KL951_001201 [Ogataea haglerorum]KAG7730089.1 hypothetical protein KL933_001169 [Ogataea haglerorum]KAG7755768.1 hypothetical protein KL911_001825 [Ogataea haglerorum]KAG7799320.1 hypothetical protein KL929_001397 [Ogataea haglerorum]KAG7803044.1 hypothetical protein KL944_001936 [Ogataea haglerorum]